MRPLLHDYTYADRYDDRYDDRYANRDADRFDDRYTVRCASPKPGSGGPPDSEIGSEAIKLRVYVRFETVAAAIACAKELHGKMFDKRTVSATFIPTSTFDAILMLPCHAI